MKQVLRRTPRDLVLDLLFFVWLIQIALTGRFLPQQIATLLHPHNETVTISVQLPSQAPSFTDPSPLLPET